jgi:DNA (cytosine-5)-methyltransferase 1
MTAYYNEHDPFAAAWLRALIAAGEIAAGEVDERSIAVVHPDDVREFAQCHWFAGIGGWSYALRLAGWPDDRPVWTGSCPCQPFSVNGRGQGDESADHLWPLWYPLVCECRPPTVFGEQVASLAGLSWYDAVASDLEDTGYAVAAADLCAASVGALHIRQRLWWVADTDSERRMWRNARRSPETGPVGSWTREQFTRLVQAETRVSLPAGRDRALVDGVSGRVGRLRGYGNAIVPQVAQTFIEAYLDARATIYVP